MKPVIIDFAPGAHEALALYYAARLALDIKAVTLSGIFQGFDRSAPSAAGICREVGIEAPVFAGAEQPIIIGRDLCDRYPRQLPTAPGGIEKHICCRSSRESGDDHAGYAWDAIYRHACEATGKLEVICLGPLTNLAIAIFKYPDLKQMISRVVFYGGALDWGNAGRTAEINLAADPHAADAISKSGMEIIMVPWSVSRDLGIEPGQLRLTGYAGQLVELILERERIPLEDPFVLNHTLAVMLAADDSHFTIMKHIIRIETKSSLCMGRTCPNLMYSLKKDPPNMGVVRTVDAASLVEFVAGL